MERSVQNGAHIRWMYAATNAIWLFLAATFIASGILKGIAMKGFAITVREFLDLLGLETLQTYSFPIAITICLFETAIGFIAFFRKFRSALCLIYPIVILFFTIITYINLTDLYGGIESCGCFGELIHLNPTETFVKNIILLLLSMFVTFTTIFHQLQPSQTSHAESAEEQSFFNDK